MRIGSNYKIACLVALVLAVYYPAIFGGINSVDDVHIIETYGVNGHVTLKDILTPGRAFYFRPLVELTYFLDYRLWGLEKSFMHLENIVLHTFNAVLVYLIAIRVVRASGREASPLPFLSAALFALHPVNTEAVSWIAGRTDPLAAFFVLIATLFLLHYLDSKKWSYLIASQAIMFFGLLAKETVLVFLPVAFLLVRCWPISDGNRNGREGDSRKGAYLLLGGSVIIIAASVLVRLYWKAGDDALAMVFRPSDLGVAKASLLCLKAFGFYIKKLFVPVPLNFAISSVSDAYALLGVPALALAAFAFWKRSVLSIFLLAAFLFVCPALFVSLAGITWTPVAERYLYLPSAFFVISLVGYCAVGFERIKREAWLIPAMSMLILPAGFIVTQRNEVWRDNLTLYRDTVKKSPDFGPARNELAVALIKEGMVEEGRRELELARKLKSSNASYLVGINLLALKLQSLPQEEARAELLRLVRGNKDADVDLLKMMKNLDEAMLSKERDYDKQRLLAREIIQTNNRLFAKTEDPFLIYRNGQLSLLLKENGAALAYFKRAAANAAEGAHFKSAAEQLAAKLSKE